MTTVASGRWTSEPELVDSAIGMNPTLATKTVISTGRKRTFGHLCCTDDEPSTIATDDADAPRLLMALRPTVCVADVCAR
jgi:hypothetical protein